MHPIGRAALSTVRRVTSWPAFPLAAAIGLSATAIVLLPPRPAALAQAAQDQPTPPIFTTEANYVRVDVFPTRNEAPVTDLTRDDFEILDNGTPQKIEQFERVVVRAPVPQDTRIEPNTVRESRAMAESPRARLFVLFLDTYHVDAADSNRIRKPLIDALDRMIGPDDLVGVMTPNMSARDVTFARKTATIEGFLTRYWYWGERNRMNLVDPEDEKYANCYRNVPNVPGESCQDQNGIAAALIDRRHEKRTMEALDDLVRTLRGVREERKAILAITDGWLLYRPDDRLMRPLNCQGPPPPPAARVDPRTGRLTTKDLDTDPAPARACELDRIALAQLDDDRAFREILDEANRANASFYPVDPRGLTVFDTPIMRLDVPGTPPPMTRPEVDGAMLNARATSLHRLAEDTDGLAILGSNDLARGFKRIVDDLSSYYLLGYYATGKLDGKFHSITVRVKRPGVQVRARRGYLAASEVDAARVARASAAPAPSAAALAEARAVNAAISPLEGYARPFDLRVQAAAGWKPGNAAAIWMVGELGTGTAWKAGADADLSLTTATGESLASARARIEAGARGFRVVLTPPLPVAPGDYVVRVRVRSADASANETIRVVLPAAPESTGAVFVRRGPSTGNRDVATSDLRFRRGDQLRVEVPSPSNGDVAARLLDRTGKPLNVPVTASVRDDADGARWRVAQLALAPLAPSDYVIEIAEGAAADQAGTKDAQLKRTLLGFRVVP